MTANYTCVFAATNQVLTQPLAPGAPPPAPAQYVQGDCNTAATALHPTRTAYRLGASQRHGAGRRAAPNFTASSPGSYTLELLAAAFLGDLHGTRRTPSSALRPAASRSRRSRPRCSTSASSGDDRSVWNNTMNLGFYSPFHPIPGISSAQYDLSWEQHFTGNGHELQAHAVLHVGRRTGSSRPSSARAS